jgi:hypothetical protein
VRDSLAASERRASSIEGRSRGGSDLFLCHRRQGRGARERFNHYFGQSPSGIQFFAREQVEQRVGPPAFLVEIRFHHLPRFATVMGAIPASAKLR